MAIAAQMINDRLLVDLNEDGDNLAELIQSVLQNLKVNRPEDVLVVGVDADAGQMCFALSEQAQRHQ